MPTLTLTAKVSPDEVATIRHAGAGKNKPRRTRKSIMKPGCVIIASSHPISDQTLYDAIHEC